jgi:hypothetical protein
MIRLIPGEMNKGGRTMELTKVEKDRLAELKAKGVAALTPPEKKEFDDLVAKIGLNQVEKDRLFALTAKAHGLLNAADKKEFDDLTAKAKKQ